MEAPSNDSPTDARLGIPALAIGSAPAENLASAAAAPWSSSHPAVASLDPPLVQQTKSEIRSLAAEIAQLASARLSFDEFFAGFLPRLCAAMGARGALVWQLGSDRELRWLAEHSAPKELLDGQQASQPHQRILECVIAEGQPILVPPGNVKLDTDRPVNPLGDSLILIPIRIQDDVEYVLEVVQRPSGGPTAQRGYLRFVAQMADLMADFVRRHQLRQSLTERQRLQRIEQHLTTVATAASRQRRQQLAADALAEIAEAYQVFLLTDAHRPKVLAVSGCRLLDARSETILAAQDFLCQMRLSGAAAAGKNNSLNLKAPQLWSAGDRRQPGAAPVENAVQADLDRLCDLLGCRCMLLLPLNEASSAVALIAFPELAGEVALDTRTSQFAAALGALLGAAHGRTWVDKIASRLLGSNTPASTRERVERWVARLALVGLACAVALFPVSQQVSATATLHPETKHAYYAPSSGVVSEVLVDAGQEVRAGQILFRLTNRELESQFDQMHGERQLTQERIEEKSLKLSRGSELTAQGTDELEGELEQLRITEHALSRQLEILSSQIQGLDIAAAEDGTVASWDLRNRLLHRPVRAGDLLATTFAPEGGWMLRIAIPDHRLGLVSQAMDASEHGARVQFSLSSHPDILLEAVARDMAWQATLESGTPSTNPRRVIQLEAIVPRSSLPIQKDGAVARASIECGKVPALWLVARDAYMAVSSRMQMLW